MNSMNVNFRSFYRSFCAFFRYLFLKFSKKKFLLKNSWNSQSFKNIIFKPAIKTWSRTTQQKKRNSRCFITQQHTNLLHSYKYIYDFHSKPLVEPLRYVKNWNFLRASRFNTFFWTSHWLKNSLLETVQGSRNNIFLRWHISNAIAYGSF
jgi:hypothetical protein